MNLATWKQWLKRLELINDIVQHIFSMRETMYSNENFKIIHLMGLLN